MGVEKRLFQAFARKEAYSGTIIRPVSFDYFPMNVSKPHRLTEEVLHSMCPMKEEWEFIYEFSLLDLADDVLGRPFDTLSGVSKRRSY